MLRGKEIFCPKKSDDVKRMQLTDILKTIEISTAKKRGKGGHNLKPPEPTTCNLKSPSHFGDAIWPYCMTISIIITQMKLSDVSNMVFWVKNFLQFYVG